jgi:hypothetical protein
VNATRAGSEATRLSIELSQSVQALVRVTEPTPVIPASEMCAALRYLAAAEFGLAQAFEQLAVCARRSADEGLFWAAESQTETAQAAKGLRTAARRLSRAAECSTDVGTLLVDARADIASEGRAVSRRLLRRRNTRCTTEDESTQVSDVAPVRLADPMPAPRPPETSRATRRVKTPRWSNPVEVATVDPAEWISPTVTAELLEITRNTLATSWVHSHIGPRRYRVQGAFVYRRSEVEAVRDHRAQVLAQQRAA